MGKVSKEKREERIKTLINLVSELSEVDQSNVLIFIEEVIRDLNCHRDESDD